MIKLTQVAGVLALGISIASAQEAPVYATITCTKAKEGKGAEYAAFRQNVGAKISKVLVDRGLFSAVIYTVASYPAGRDARCDYQTVSISNGFPPPASELSGTEEDIKKAGIPMSRQAMLDKREELRIFVGREIWLRRATVGGVVKGGYVRVNYNKTKPNMLADWIRLETTGWKPLAESAAKDLGTGWSAWTLAMPGGTGVANNTMTVDAFPSWEALGKGIPSRAIWNKVHPEMDAATFTDRVAAVAERTHIDVMRIVDVITK